MHPDERIGEATFNNKKGEFLEGDVILSMMEEEEVLPESPDQDNPQSRRNSTAWFRTLIDSQASCVQTIKSLSQVTEWAYSIYDTRPGLFNDSA